jgi:RNA polymerase primary sigma factor
MTAKQSAPIKAAKPAAKALPAKAKAADTDESKKPVAKPLVKAGAKDSARASTKATAKVVDDAQAKRGRKGKVDDKPAADVEEDFSDIEGDLEGEPEVDVAEAVDVAEDGEAKAKAKPLRMKVSRAKERALMREFGLDETALTEEEVAKRRQELKTLIKMGKTRGFLTHQEINDHLPE